MFEYDREQFDDGFIVEYWYDSDTINPRENYDHVARMVCRHDRYRLGDEQTKFSDISYILDDIAYHEDCKVSDIYWQPLSLHDHSRLSMSLGWSRGWDSGTAGIIYVTRQKLGEDYPDFHPRWYEKLADEVFRDEVAEYDTYLRGEVTGYTIIRPDGIPTTTVGGFYDQKEMEHSASLDLAYEREVYANRWVRVMMAWAGNDLATTAITWAGNNYGQ